MPDPAPRPAIKVGMDARLLAAQALAYGDQNARRLEQAEENYHGIVTEYGGQ